MFFMFLCWEKYSHDPTHIIDWVVIQVESKAEPLHILDMKEILLWNWAITKVKVQWKHFTLEEVTWEMDDVMRKAYQFLFQQWNDLKLNIEDDVALRGEECNSP